MFYYIYIIVGNKIDNQNRVVSEESGQRYADENGFFFHEMSVKNNNNVNKLFEDISQGYLKEIKEDNTHDLLNKLKKSEYLLDDEGNCMEVVVEMKVSFYFFLSYLSHRQILPELFSFT